MNTENSNINEPHKFALNLSQILDLRSSDKHIALQNFYSVSDIQDYTKYIIKKHETLTTNPPIHVYINRINNRLVFKIKDGYKVELQTLETMKLFGSIKN